MIVNYSLYCESEGKHPHPEQLLCIKEGKDGSYYEFTLLETYRIYLTNGSLWYAVWNAYDEFVTRSNSTIDWVHLYLIQDTGWGTYRYYYEDGGALFTTETEEEYTKRMNTEKFDL